MHDAEAFGFLERGLETADGDVGVRVDVLLQHLFVVHLVDVIAGEQHHELGTIALDDVDVLIDRVGGPEVPHRLVDALRSGQDVEAFVALGPEEVPASLEVADEAVGLVLGGDGDAANAGVERIREREVDDARFAAEVDRRLGAPVGELEQAAASPAGEHVGHGVARIRRRNAELLCRFRFDHGELRQDAAPSAAGGVKTRNSVASGGSVNVAEAGKPCEGRASAATPPRLSMFEPP